MTSLAPIIMTIIQGLCLFSHVSGAKLLTHRNKRDIAYVGDCIKTCKDLLKDAKPDLLKGAKLTLLCEYKEHAECIVKCIQSQEVLSQSDLPTFMKGVGQQLCDFKDVIIGTHICRTQAKEEMDPKCKVDEIKGIEVAESTSLDAYCYSIRFALQCTTSGIKKHCKDAKGAVYAETLLYAYTGVQFAIQSLHLGLVDMSYGPEHVDCTAIFEIAKDPLSDNATPAPIVAQPPSTSTEASTESESTESEEPYPNGPDASSVSTLSPHYIIDILSFLHALYFLV